MVKKLHRFLFSERFTRIFIDRNRKHLNRVQSRFLLKNIMLKINNLMFKNLIESEFLLLSTKLDLNTRNLNTGKEFQGLDKNKPLTLEISALVKTLKQFIRILQFLKKKEKSVMVVCSSTKDIACFLTLFEKAAMIDPSIRLEENFSTVENYSKKVKSLLLLGPRKKKPSVLKKLVEEDILIISQVSLDLESSNSGTYKIHNDLTDVKKLVFLMSMINIILKEGGLDKQKL